MSHYVRTATIDTLTVLTAYRNGRRHIKVPGAKGTSLGGKRLRTFFETGFCCVECSIEATFFAVEKHKTSASPKFHLNLYGMRNGKEVLFTHDHTLARALGGSDTLDNMKTMCSPCNNRKARVECKLVEQMRKNEHKKSRSQ